MLRNCGSIGRKPKNTPKQTELELYGSWPEKLCLTVLCMLLSFALKANFFPRQKMFFWKGLPYQPGRIWLPERFLGQPFQKLTFSLGKSWFLEGSGLKKNVA